MVYGIQLKDLVLLLSGGGEVATFWRSLLSGGRCFRDLLAATKNGVNFGGSLLSEIDGITVCYS